MDNKISEQRQLIEACKRNDTEAKKKLYELYAPVMFGICVRYVKEKESAKDILQEGFIKIFTKIDDYSGAGSFEAWMKKIFVTTALEHLRSAKVWRSNISMEDYNETIVDNFDVSMVSQLSADEILKYINELPTGFRTVFNLYAIEGYSHAEIARMLKIKEASSRSQLARARQLLQNKIQKLYL
ncbi:MAG: sigma-70 family RNA polymerase sigma factor [Dysgonamonadaceae bacterium]|jgi:RNA polymerase sigma-70 factor (ECF subfamily)|nr:sigma-70 family RNA polymerase sigma factor [Dysgonamonadaceae bacterium]